MSEIWKLLGQGLGVFAITFGIFFWILEGAPLPYAEIKMKSIEPAAEVPVFRPVESRLGHPKYLQEEEPQKKIVGDNDPRRMKYRAVLKNAIEAVESDYCAVAPKKLLAVAIMAYIQAKKDDVACLICFWGKSEDEVIRDWSTPLDQGLNTRMGELMLHGYLAREDFKNPPVLFNLRPRNSSPENC